MSRIVLPFVRPRGIIGLIEGALGSVEISGRIPDVFIVVVDIDITSAPGAIVTPTAIPRFPQSYAGKES